MFQHNLNVYLAPGATDLRKSINGLSILVENQMALNPFSGYLFAFCNRKRTTFHFKQPSFRCKSRLY